MKKITLVAAAIALFSAQAVNAADGTINFTGNITDTACTVDTSSATQTVALGSVSATTFTGAGSTAAASRFTINLKTCPESVTTAKVRFDGQTSSANSSILALNSGESATNVGVAIYEKDSATLIPIGKDSAGVTLSKTGTNALDYIAKYMASGATVQAGSANATATFTIIYS